MHAKHAKSSFITDFNKCAQQKNSEFTKCVVITEMVKNCKAFVVVGNLSFWCDIIHIFVAPPNRRRQCIEHQNAKLNKREEKLLCSCFSYSHVQETRWDFSRSNDMEEKGRKKERKRASEMEMICSADDCVCLCAWFRHALPIYRVSGSCTLKFRWCMWCNGINKALLMNGM